MDYYKKYLKYKEKYMSLKMLGGADKSESALRRAKKAAKKALQKTAQLEEEKPIELPNISQINQPKWKNIIINEEFINKIFTENEMLQLKKLLTIRFIIHYMANQSFDFIEINNASNYDIVFEIINSATINKLKGSLSFLDIMKNLRNNLKNNNTYYNSLTFMKYNIDFNGRPYEIDELSILMRFIIPYLVQIYDYNKNKAALLQKYCDLEGGNCIPKFSLLFNQRNIVNFIVYLDLKYVKEYIENNYIQYYIDNKTIHTNTIGFDILLANNIIKETNINEKTVPIVVAKSVWNSLIWAVKYFLTSMRPMSLEVYQILEEYPTIGQMGQQIDAELIKTFNNNFARIDEKMKDSNDNFLIYCLNIKGKIYKINELEIFNNFIVPTLIQFDNYRINYDKDSSYSERRSVQKIEKIKVAADKLAEDALKKKQEERESSLKYLNLVMSGKIQPVSGKIKIPVPKISIPTIETTSQKGIKNIAKINKLQQIDPLLFFKSSRKIKYNEDDHRNKTDNTDYGYFDIMSLFTKDYLCAYVEDNAIIVKPQFYTENAKYEDVDIEYNSSKEGQLKFSFDNYCNNYTQIIYKNFSGRFNKLPPYVQYWIKDLRPYQIDNIINELVMYKCDDNQEIKPETELVLFKIYNGWDNYKKPTNTYCNFCNEYNKFTGLSCNNNHLPFKKMVWLLLLDINIEETSDNKYIIKDINVPNQFYFQKNSNFYGKYYLISDTSYHDPSKNICSLRYLSEQQKKIINDQIEYINIKYEKEKATKVELEKIYDNLRDKTKQSILQEKINSIRNNIVSIQEMGIRINNIDTFIRLGKYLNIKFVLHTCTCPFVINNINCILKYLHSHKIEIEQKTDAKYMFVQNMTFIANEQLQLEASSIRNINEITNEIANSSFQELETTILANFNETQNISIKKIEKTIASKIESDLSKVKSDPIKGEPIKQPKIRPEKIGQPGIFDLYINSDIDSIEIKELINTIAATENLIKFCTHYGKIKKLMREDKNKNQYEYSDKGFFKNYIDKLEGIYKLKSSDSNVQINNQDKDIVQLVELLDAVNSNYSILFKKLSDPSTFITDQTEYEQIKQKYGKLINKQFNDLTDNDKLNILKIVLLEILVNNECSKIKPKVLISQLENNEKRLKTLNERKNNWTWAIKTDSKELQNNIKYTFDKLTPYIITEITYTPNEKIEGLKSRIISNDTTLMELKINISALTVDNNNKPIGNTILLKGTNLLDSNLIENKYNYLCNKLLSNIIHKIYYKNGKELDKKYFEIAEKSNESEELYEIYVAFVDNEGKIHYISDYKNIVDKIIQKIIENPKLYLTFNDPMNKLDNILDATYSNLCIKKERIKTTADKDGNKLMINIDKHFNKMYKELYTNLENAQKMYPELYTKLENANKMYKELYTKLENAQKMHPELYTKLENAKKMYKELYTNLENAETIHPDLYTYTNLENVNKMYKELYTNLENAETMHPDLYTNLENAKKMHSKLYLKSTKEIINKTFNHLQKCGSTLENKSAILEKTQELTTIYETIDQSITETIDENKGFLETLIKGKDALNQTDILKKNNKLTIDSIRATINKIEKVIGENKQIIWDFDGIKEDTKNPFYMDIKIKRNQLDKINQELVSLTKAFNLILDEIDIYQGEIMEQEQAKYLEELRKGKESKKKKKQIIDYDNLDLNQYNIQTEDNYDGWAEVVKK